MNPIRMDADGNRRTREEMIALPLTEKIRAVEAWQKREYGRVAARAIKTGRKIPSKWQRWKRAQDSDQPWLQRQGRVEDENK